MLETLCQLDWVGQLQEEPLGDGARFVLLADPDTTPLSLLLDTLLLHQGDSTRNFWQNSGWSTMTLREAL